MRVILNVFLILVLISGCDPVDNKLKVINLSGERIYLLRSHRAKLSAKYRDDVALSGSGFGFINYIEQVEPNDTLPLTKLGNSSNTWIRYINNVCEDGKLRLYTFSLDTLQKYSWKTVLEKEYYNRKVELSVKDLDKQNWVVVFD